MKKTLVIILIAALMTSILSGGCGAIITGSGNLVTETYDYSDFTILEVHVGR